mgnify:CR=1 FL=1
MRGTVFSRLRRGVTNLLRDRRGNAFMLTAAALVPVVGIVGSAVDIGRAYMTQLRLQQACDAGVLAGRRAMGPGTYGTDEEAEADKMFNFNFPAGRYGATDISFASEANGTTDVDGTASATLPTALMYIFGKSQFDLSASCTAKLEISNVDVVLVLDVTGSMAGTPLAGLKTAAKNFFTTLTSADVGDGRIRFGVVPYSSTVNVGKILRTADSSWLSTTVTLPSRQYNNKFSDINCDKKGKNCTRVYEYTYSDRTFTVGSPTVNGSLTFNTGTAGANASANWNGCIMERWTQQFAANATAPEEGATPASSRAYDMEIDTVPTADDKTKWKVLLPITFVYNRGQVASEITTDNLSKPSSACPLEAMKLTEMDSGDQGTFDTYIDKLAAGGNTYHDVGMAWGARFISPTGLFADENADADGQPISRHIVFMTDGNMDTTLQFLSHQGLEQSMPRIGSTSKGDGNARHTNRFLQLCQRARARGITIWVVSFGIGTNESLDTCASSGTALLSSNTADLNSNFQSIARQMSKLRLAQ